MKEREFLAFKDLEEGDYIWGYDVEKFQVVKLELFSIRATTQTGDGKPRVRFRFYDPNKKQGQAFLLPKQMSESTWEKGIGDNYECPWKIFIHKKEAIKDSLVVGRYKMIYLEMELKKLRKTLGENRKLELLEYEKI